MSPDFEFQRSDWSITVGLRELLHAEMMQQSLNRHGSDTSVTWLTRGADGRRLWICSDEIHLAWVTAVAEAKDPHFALPIPDMFLGQLLDLCQVSGSLEIFCNEVEGTIIARAGDGRYIAIDHPRTPEFTEREMPYLENPDRSHDSPAVAHLTTAELVLFADMVMAVPNHVSVREHGLPPFVTVSLDNNTFAWTIDWRRHGLGRTTGAVPARVTGSVTSTFYPYSVIKMLKSNDHPEDARIFIDGPDSEFAYFVTDNWGIRVTLDREHLAKWMAKLGAALGRFGDHYEEQRHHQIPDRIRFDLNGRVCFGSIHQSEDFDHETVRLTHVVATGVHPIGEVLDRINELNQHLLGVTIEWRDGEVRLVLETLASHLDNFDSHLDLFSAAVTKISSTNDFLPLFTQQLQL